MITPPTPTTPTPDAPDFDTLHEQAKNAAFENDFAKALSLCQRALKLQPNEPRARFNCAVYACQLGDSALVAKYLTGLDTPKAAKLRQRCITDRAAPAGY